MKKKVIRLTESQLKQIIENQIQQLNEINMPEPWQVILLLLFLEERKTKWKDLPKRMMGNLNLMKSDFLKFANLMGYHIDENELDRSFINLLNIAKQKLSKLKKIIKESIEQKILKEGYIVGSEPLEKSMRLKEILKKIMNELEVFEDLVINQFHSESEDYTKETYNLIYEISSVINDMKILETSLSDFNLKYSRR